jgi:hypothetical protein
MSLKHIENRREPTVFGADLNVLLGDMTINGDLDVIGLINGKSSQGQNQNNQWTGTNEWSVDRPQTVPTTGVGDSGISVAQKELSLVANSIINQGATWTGTNDFPLGLKVEPIIPIPVNGNDAIPLQYVKNRANQQVQDYFTEDNTWTSGNTFQILPLCIEPVADTEIATKNYVDTSCLNLVAGRSYTTAGVGVEISEFSNALALNIQLIGGGGGSTSGYNPDTGGSGYAGGAGSAVSLLVLNKVIGGLPQGTWTITSGLAGTAGIGTTLPQAASGAGGNSLLFVQPNNGSGLNEFEIQVLRAAAGQGNQAFNGNAGNPSAGGIYTPVNGYVALPWAQSSGQSGQFAGSRTRQLIGYNIYGWGGGTNPTGGDGEAGQQGAFVYVEYLDL